MASTPAYAATPKIGIAQVTTANANRDGTGSVVDIITGATNGTRIDKITVTAVGTTTAGMVRIYISDGTNTRLYYEFAVTAITPSATVQAFTASLTIIGGLTLPLNYKIRASTEKTETFNVFAEGGDI